MDRWLGDRLERGERRNAHRHRPVRLRVEQRELGVAWRRLGRRRRSLEPGLDRGCRPVAVDLEQQPRVAALDHDRLVGDVVERRRIESVEHPADRRPLVRRPPRVDRAGDDQAVDRPRHRDVVEAPSLGLVRRLLGLPQRVVVECALPGARQRMTNLEAEASVGQADDLFSASCRAVAAGVRDDHDRELEALGGMHRQQPDGVGAFVLGKRLGLVHAGCALVGDEADEALDVPAAEILERAREPAELADVRVAAATVPLREHREVVVVLRDDLLEQALEPGRLRADGQPVVALPKRAEELLVALDELRRKRALEPREERAAARRTAQKDERVVRDADERRREHRHERLVVVTVMEQAQVRDEIGDLLLPEIAAPRRAIRGQSGSSQLLLEHVGIRPRREQEDDVPGRRLAAVAELAHALRGCPGLAAAPRRVRSLVALLVRDEQLDGRARRRVGEASRGLEPLEVVPELRREQLVDDSEQLRPRAVVERQGQDVGRAGAAFLEDVDVGVAEAVDGLELVTDEEQLVRVEQIDQLALQPVRVLELVDHDRAEAQPLALGDLGDREKIARPELEILEIERRLTILRLLVGGAEPGQELLQQVAVGRREDVEGRLLERAAGRLVRGEPLLPAAAHGDGG